MDVKRSGRESGERVDHLSVAVAAGHIKVLAEFVRAASVDNLPVEFLIVNTRYSAALLVELNPIEAVFNGSFARNLRFRFALSCISNAVTLVTDGRQILRQESNM